MSVRQSVIDLAKARRLELLTSLGAFVVFCAFSGPMLFKQSGAPHFVYQAYAFLHGHLDVPFRPPILNDWVLWNNRWYVSFPIFPAILMLPFVALNGAQFNDVFFTVCIAAANVGLFVGVLRSYRDAGEHDRPDWQLVLLAIFFAFGTVYFCAAIRGEVWFTAHVIGVTLTLIYLWASLDARRPVIAGLALGCAAVTRAPLDFAFPFFLLEALALQPVGTSLVARARSALPSLLKCALPAAGVFALALLFNHARWDSWTEFGHSMLYNNRVTERVRLHGLFNWDYLPGNFNSAFLMLPTFESNPFRVTFDPNGMSMFVTTPLLLAVPFALQNARTSLALAFTAMTIAVPGLFYMNNGFSQFGFRFSIDYLPYLFLVLALGRLPMRGFFILAGVAGIVVNTWGATVFGRH